LRSSVDREMQTLVRRKSVAAKIRGAFQKVGGAIKKGFQKVGQGIKTAAKKVGGFIKTTGAKVAKFGLKVMSTVQSVGAKVMGVIPRFKGLSKVVKAESAVTNTLSNRIHVGLGKKLEEGMRVMDKIRSPVSGVGGKVMGAIFKREEDDEWILKARRFALESRVR